MADYEGTCVGGPMAGIRKVTKDPTFVSRNMDMSVRDRQVDIETVYRYVDLFGHGVWVDTEQSTSDIIKLLLESYRVPY
jgi:hypothetical protein